MTEAAAPVRTVGRLAFLAVVVLPLLAHATLLKTERDWAFVQSVGGALIGVPERVGEGWYLPLLCDVSGTRKFAVEPRQLNSSLVWAGTQAEVGSGEIAVTISTGIAHHSGTSACGAVELGRVRPGTYRIVYRDPDGSRHFMGQVEIGP